MNPSTGKLVSKKTMRVTTLFTGVCAGVFVPMTAQAAHAATATRSVFQLKNAWNGECLNGREGANGVTMQPCSTQPQESWSWYEGQVRNYFNDQCLNGREGANGVTMQPCNTQPQEGWYSPLQAGLLQNAFNNQCLSGREGDVNMQLCNVTNVLQLWGSIAPVASGGRGF
jgi:hypothetical protein